MTDPVPAHSIDRKLQALAKRIAAEKQHPKVMERPPTDGLTSTVLTPRKEPTPTSLETYIHHELDPVIRKYLNKWPVSFSTFLREGPK